jgi:hypothetical protein
MRSIAVRTELTRAASRTLTPTKLRRGVCLLLVGLFMALAPARADEPEDVYLRIYTLVQQADTLKANGQSANALAKYQEAQKALLNFQRENPQWNKPMVAFRLNDVTQKMAALYETAPTPAQGPKVRPATSAQVKLLEAGAEPRKVLRLHPKAGDKQTLGMTLKMAMEMKMGDTEMPAMKMPAISLTMDATVKSVSPEGEITYDMVMSDASVAEDAEVLPQIAEAMKTAFTSIKGSSGAGTMSDRGLSKGVELKGPAGAAAPQVNQAMEQMREAFAHVVVALPEEAVGAGARWQASRPLKTQGMTIEQTTTYELVSVAGERATVKSTIAQQAANQKIENPVMPGMKLDVTKMTGTGNGEIRLDLTKLLAPEGTMDLHTDIEMGLDMGGQKQAMNTKLDLKMRLEAK